MSPSISISANLYTRLEGQARGFDTPANVIERLLEHYEGCDTELETSLDEGDTHQAIRTTGNSVSDWKESIEIALGFKNGVSKLDQNASFIKNIYTKFRSGEPAYGVSGVKAMKALFQVIEKYEPQTRRLALEGLKASIEQSDKPFHKLRALYHELSGEQISPLIASDSESASALGRLLQKGNGHQHTNKRAAYQWLLKRCPGATPSTQANLAINLPQGHYRVMASAEQNGLMLANTKHIKKGSDLPPWIASKEYDGMLVVRQFPDGLVKGYRFDDLAGLWNAKDRPVAISWDVAKNYAVEIE
ncbi:MAG: hypothetical protein WBM41_16585 [Arenicellales bacterium]